MTKLVPSLREKNYEDRLQELNLYPPEIKRVRSDVIETFEQFEIFQFTRFKILNILEDIDTNELLTINV